MEKYIGIIEKDGFAILISLILIFFLVKYFNKRIDKKPCVQDKRFEKLEKDVQENRNILIEIKSLLQGFFYGFKYKDKNDD